MIVLTLNKQNQIEQRVNHRLDGRDPGNMAVKQVERGEAPARRPDEDIITPCKKPYERNIGEWKDAGAVRHVAYKLGGDLGPAT